MAMAEADHRAHAIIEQARADVRSGALAHLPSGSFAANSAWLVLAAIAHHLRRAAGTLASMFRESDHWNHPSPADRHPRPARPPSASTSCAPADQLALAPRVGEPVRRGVRATRAHHDLMVAPAPRADQEPSSGRAGQASNYHTPPNPTVSNPRSTTPDKFKRWIQAQRRAWSPDAT